MEMLFLKVERERTSDLKKDTVHKCRRINSEEEVSFRGVSRNHFPVFWEKHPGQHNIPTLQRSNFT